MYYMSYFFQFSRNTVKRLEEFKITLHFNACSLLNILIKYIAIQGKHIVVEKAPYSGLDCSS